MNQSLQTANEAANHFRERIAIEALHTSSLDLTKTREILIEAMSWAVNQVLPKEKDESRNATDYFQGREEGYNTCRQEILDKKRDIGL